MTYEEFLVVFSDAAPEQAYDILYENPDHEYKKGYELIISKDAEYSYLYAKYVIQGRFELGEKAISKNPFYSWLYAKEVIRGRFELGEEVIKNSHYKNEYAYRIMKNLNFW